MYILTDLAKAAQDEKLRIAARDQLRGQAYAARRAGNRRGPARRPADLRILHVLHILRVLRSRRAARAY